MNNPRRPLPRTRPPLYLVCLGDDAASQRQCHDLTARLRLIGLECTPLAAGPKAVVANEQAQAVEAVSLGELHSQATAAAVCDHPQALCLIFWPQDAGLEPQQVARELQSLSQRLPEVPCLLLADVDQAQALGPALLGWVAACLASHASAREILRVVQIVQLQGCYFAPDIKQRLLEPLVGTASLALSPQPAADPLSLTPREQQIWQLVLQGLTSRAIAEQLAISVRTVDAHRRNLRQKVGA